MSGPTAARRFVFYPHAQFVRGRTGAAVHDLFDKRLIWLREPALAAAVGRLAQGQTVADAAEGAGVPTDVLAGYVAAMAQLELGMTVDGPTAVEGYRPGVLRSQASDLGVFRTDSTLTVELTGKCVYDCPWCTSRNRLTQSACACGRWDDGGPALPLERLLSAVEDLSLVGVSRLVVKGGEPLLEPDRLWGLIEASLAHSLRCEIHSTGLPLDERALRAVAGRPVSFVFLVPSHEPATFDRLVGVAGSQARLRGNLAALRAAGVRFGAIVPAAIEGLEAAEATAAWAQAEGARQIEYLFHVPAGAGGLPAMRKALAPQTPTDMAVDLQAFLRNGQSQYCFDRAYFIAADGRVTPCIGRREPLAHLAESDMATILREARLASLDHTGRPDVPACAGCEFRYGCTACLVRSEEHAGPGAPHWSCPYDPASGAWIGAG